MISAGSLGAASTALPSAPNDGTILRTGGKNVEEVEEVEEEGEFRAVPFSQDQLSMAATYQSSAVPGRSSASLYTLRTTSDSVRSTSTDFLANNNPSTWTVNGGGYSNSNNNNNNSTSSNGNNVVNGNSVGSSPTGTNNMNSFASNVNPAGTISPEMLKQGLGEYSWSPLDGTKKVFTKLSLPNAGVRFLDVLLDFGSIQTLDLRDNGLTDVSILSCMPYLVSLNLSGNRLVKTPELDPPPFNLQELDCSRNQILTIGSMEKYRFLKWLCLDRNLIKKISGLEECKNLQCLSLRANGISRIENLDGLPLKVLDLRNNRIRTLDNLQTLVELQELQLSHNYISSLNGLENHPLLTTLNLEANDITDIEELQYVQDLNMLRSLTLGKNPIEVNVHPIAPNPFHKPVTPQLTNRYLFLHLIPNLNILDGLPVSVEDKIQAANLYNPLPAVTASLQHALDIQRATRQYARIHASDLALSDRFQPIAVAGPAGAGKRTLTQRLLQEYPNLFGVCVSHTTRAPRPGEENGVHYHFVAKEEMQTMMETGQFVEVVSFFGNWYGNSFESIYKVALSGKVCIMDLELEGVLALKRSIINSRYVFISPPSMEALQYRLELRMNQQREVARQIQEKERVEEERKRVARQQQITSKVTNKPVLTDLNDEEVKKIMYESRFAESKMSIASGNMTRPATELRQRSHGTSAATRHTSASDRSTGSTPQPSRHALASFMERARADASRPTGLVTPVREEPVDDISAADSSVSVQQKQPQQHSAPSQNPEDGEMLVPRWLEKAHQDTQKQQRGTNNQEETSATMYANYLAEPGFFDLVLVNDDLERAYQRFKETVMGWYWESYDNEKN